MRPPRMSGVVFRTNISSKNLLARISSELFNYHFDIRYVILKIMKKFFEKSSKSKVFWIALIIIVQTIVYVIAGAGKSYIHMDEAYSLSLANYDRIQIQENEDFYNEWHDGDYYKDYLVVNEDEKGDFAPVYNNQRDDVHPPLFYLLLRIGMEMTPGEFSKWTGITINIICFAINTVFLYLIVDKLLVKEKSRLVKAFVLTLAASVTIAAISTVMYIRMYAMLTMWVTITVCLHLLLLESKKVNPKLLVATGIVALLGVLTQYYYVFVLAPLFITLVVKYCRAKRWSELKFYIGTLVVAAVVSLIIWPYSIQHMFFGYRGQGAMGNLLNFAHLGTQIGIFLGIVVLYDFHYTLPFILIAMFVLAIYGLKHHKVLDVNKRQDDSFALILWPVLFYLVIASIASPFTDLRYLEPICGLLFVAVMFGLYKLVGMISEERKRNVIMSVVLVVVAILPIPMKIEPDVEYSRFAEVVKIVEENHEIPAIYLFNPGNNRFLDDILLFSKLDESYVMQDQEYTIKTFEKILAGKNLSNGLFVFANYGYGSENDQYIEVLQEATGLDEKEYIFQLNSGALYLLK